MPGLDEASIRSLLAAFNARRPAVAVPTAAGRRQPLPSVWDPDRCRDAAREALAAGRLALELLLERLDVLAVELPAAALVNWNRPEDL
jgi:molybdopterin-guanine dinucleotide biosynthesis protein A